MSKWLRYLLILAITLLGTAEVYWFTKTSDLSANLLSASSVRNLQSLSREYAIEEVAELFPGQELSPLSNFFLQTNIFKKVSTSLSEFKEEPTLQFQGQYIPNRLIFKIGNKPLENVFLAKLDEADTDQILEKAAQEFKVKIKELVFAEPDRLVLFEQPTVSSTCRPNSKNLRQLGIKTTLKRVLRQSNSTPQLVKVAVIDTGLAPNSELQKIVALNQFEKKGQTYLDDDNNTYIDDINGWNFPENDPDATDKQGHGTHVIGILKRVVSATGANFNAFPLKAISERFGSISDIARALKYAADNDFKIANLSFGIYAPSNLLKEATSFADQHQVLLVAAAGNNNDTIPAYPAFYPEVLSVAAVDQNNQKSPKSNYGDWVKLVAPGVNIRSNHLNNSYKCISGTSQAAPHITALAIILKSYFPALTNTQVRQILLDSAKPLANELGAGIPQLDQAIKLARQIMKTK
ncbi:hypothetical protein COT40_00155 [Candidatus Peregrinibacteria bacterium CG08_land_8_20_14_0_20_41_10]|nr:MAG: hypothetical protein COT40_00155 [Candidatus Peregrinibacteria bacterium CG08_land_8_20_14_0_20_41_10]